MTRHIDLLGVFYQLWGALALIAGTAVLVLGVGALAIVTSVERAALGSDMGANLTVVLFFVFAAGAAEQIPVLHVSPASLAFVLDGRSPASNPVQVTVPR